MTGFMKQVPFCFQSISLCCCCSLCRCLHCVSAGNVIRALFLDSILLLIGNKTVSSSPCLLNRFSHVRLFVILWTVACHSPLSIGFSRQEHWSGLPCLPPGDLPDPGIEPAFPELAHRIFLLSHEGSLYIYMLLSITIYFRGSCYTDVAHSEYLNDFVPV